MSSWKSVIKERTAVYLMVSKGLRLSALVAAGAALVALAAGLSGAGNEKAKAAMPPQSHAHASEATPVAMPVPDPKRDVREVVKAQMQAIKARDESAAFQYVSPDYREKYEDAKTFFRVLRFGYRPLYRHMSYNFLSGTARDDVAWQRVELTGPDGEPDIAIIRLIRGESGAWLIDGYTVLRSEHEPL